MTAENTSARSSRLARFVATGAFVGYIPWASGTFGSLAGLLVVLLAGVSQPLLFAVLIAAGFFAGVFTSAVVARTEGHRLTRTAELAKETFQPGTSPHADPSIVVIDEIVGMWIALWLLPHEAGPIIIAFLLFRLFDIVKPFPARQLERIPNGWGIMLDDVVAGLYANIATRGILLAVEWIAPPSLHF